jgi:MFS family permease
MLRRAGMLGGAVLGFVLGGYLGGQIELHGWAPIGTVSIAGAVLGVLGGAMLIRRAWPKQKPGTMHTIYVGDDEE